MISVFVDTDVILDLFIHREPHHSEALRFFSQIRKKKVRCFTSPIVLANTYYILAKIRNKSYAIGKVRALRKLVAITMVNQAIIDAAIQSPHKDFEDSIQYHCALANGIKFLVTRNTADFPKGRMSIVLPREFTKFIESAGQ